MPLQTFDTIETESPTKYIDEAVGRRYVGCTFANFDCQGKDSGKKQDALNAAVDYANRFREHYEAGRSLVFVGPKGTGKDHLMTAVIRQVALGWKQPGKVVFRDGLRLFAEFRGAFGSPVTEDQIVDKYIAPMLLAISDPLPPVGSLSEYEKRMTQRIIDGRYRDAKPITSTINAINRNEVTERLGVQATDRLFEDAIVVRCNWASHRVRNFE
jgi:DNA replication protein DnaC